LENHCYFGLLKKYSRHCFIEFLGEHEINGVAKLVNGAA
jgi:hypothetical protein